MSHKKKPGVIPFLLENSGFLIIGAAVGLIWANVDPHGYHRVQHPLHFAVNDIAMAFFFLIAGKEIREAMLPGGPLSSARTAALPITATLGGMVGPAAIFLAGAHFLDRADLTRGWAIPMATDIAFSYLVARLIFPRIGGRPHPAIVFLLLLAIADDAGGLIVLATAYPQDVHGILPFLHGVPPKLTFAVGLAAAIGLSLFMWKRLKIASFWPYLLGPGVISWFAFHEGGIHAALALVPLAWCLPHAHSDMGIWAVGESQGKDTLNRMEHWWKNPVEIFLGFFGFVNAGVEFSAMGTGTWLVLAGLLFGKPIGIVLFTKLGQLAGLKLPEGMDTRDLLVVGVAAGIGFTVALFISVVAFDPNTSIPGMAPEQIRTLLDSVKMGALFSFGVAPIAIILALLLGVRRRARNYAEAVEAASSE
jgi:NhaA family Na+:H+ antiporter